MPEPRQSSISSRAWLNTSSGNTAGPALKLYIRAITSPLLFGNSVSLARAAPAHPSESSFARHVTVACHGRELANHHHANHDNTEFGFDDALDAHQFLFIAGGDE